jgi:hemolysin III
MSLEEKLNSITHGVGAVFSVPAAIVLLLSAAGKGDPLTAACFAVYGASLVLLFTMSTVSHALTAPGPKRFFETMDFFSIYFLIAGTYTPVALVVLGGGLGRVLFWAIWGLLVAGVAFRIFFSKRRDLLSLAIYLLMGWMIVVAVKPLFQHSPPGFFAWLFTGGAFYTVGCVFFSLKRMRFHHPVWHLFVLAGAACHWNGFRIYLAA